MNSSVAVRSRRAPASQGRGFSLIELMIVVTIISILAAIAVPSYQQYNKKANRSQASQIMLSIQNREEQYILDARAYTTALNNTGLNIIQDGWACTAASCTNTWYTVSVTVPHPTLSAPSYLITATPIAGTPQVTDGTLTLTSAGIRSRSAGDGKW